MVFIDTHCHLNHQDFAAELPEAAERARGAGVAAMVVVGYDLPSSERAVELAETLPGVWATVGIHPHDARGASEAALARVAELARHPRVVAIGEIGLDFYRDLSPREEQHAAFRAQLDLAAELGLPVVIHTRDSMSEALEVLLAPGRRVRGVLHCWSGTLPEARRATAAGWWLGIGGVVTFSKAIELHEVVAAVEPDRLLLETDAPYLAPHPHRSRRNEPAYLPHVAERVAALRGLDIAAVAEQTMANARACFPRLAPHQ